MNNKIKAADVACLIDKNVAYEEVYDQLKQILSSDGEMIFAERTSGYGFLQWELPGEGWFPLDKADPIQGIEVKKELERRKQHVKAKTGDSPLTAQILTYPDDSYVFYKMTLAGQLLILLTAWGYRHPERIDGGSASGHFTPPQSKEPVTVQFTYGGRPMAEKPFILIGKEMERLEKKTDVNGVYQIGDLPLGYQFDLEINGKKHHVTIEEGKGQITIDATVYATVEVKATLDGQPYGNVPVRVNYGGQQLQLICDGQGTASAQLPLAEGSQPCTVTVEQQPQSKPLSPSVTRFSFDFVTPAPEPEPEPEPEPIPLPEPEPTPEPEPQPEPIPQPVPDPEPDPEPQPDPNPKGNGGCLTSLLFGLGLALLVATAFYFGWRLL